MELKKQILNAENIITSVFEWTVRILLIFITLIISVQVLLRAVFKYSIPSAEEVAIIAFIYITFLSAAVACKYDIHLRVELFVAWLPKKGRLIVEYINVITLLIIGILMVFYGAKLTAYGVSSIMPATRWPTSVIYLPAPIAGVFCAFHQILRLTGIADSAIAKNFIERENV